MRNVSSYGSSVQYKDDEEHWCGDEEGQEDGKNSRLVTD